MEQLKPIAKFVAALATSVVITAGAFATDGKITGSEWLLILVSLAGSGAVYGVKNQPGKHERAPVAE